jgi:hypothetical protein
VFIEGQPYENQWPYQNTPAAALSIGSPPNTFQVLRRKVPLDGKSFDQVCGLLDVGHPVLLGVRISESFYLPNTDGRGKTRVLVALHWRRPGH